MEKIIFHITTKSDWEKAMQLGYFEVASLSIEGFIHCSTKDQVNGVLERYYKGQTNLVKLVINIEKLTSRLEYELAPSVNEMFPHIFGIINIEAVEQVIELN